MSAVIALLAAAGCVVALTALRWSSWRLAGALCGGGVSALRVAAATYLAVVQIAVIVEALGILSLLDWPLVLVLHVAIAAVVWWRVPRPVPPAAEGRPDHSWRPWMLVAAVAVPLASLAIVQSLTSPANEFDTLRYHLVNAGFWLDGHSILQFPTGFPSDAAAPGLGELLAGWLMLPTHSTELAFLLPTLFTGVAAVALVAIAVELGYPPWRGGLAALLFALVPLCYLGETDSLVMDMVVVAGVAGAALFALRAARGRRWLVLAGACLGLACAAKGSGPVVAVLVIGWASVFPGRRHPLRTAVTMAVPVLVLAGVWYLRNWVELGSPVFPYGLTLAGRVIWRGGPDPLTAGDPTFLAAVLQHRWATVHQVGAYLVDLLGPLLIALVAAPAVLVWAARRRNAPLVGLLSLGLILVAGYVITPYTGSPLDQPLGSATRFVLWWIDLLLLGVVLVLPWRPLALLALAGVLYGGDLALFPSFHPALIVTAEAAWLTAALTAAVVAVCVLAHWWRHGGHRLPRPPWPALAAILALAVLLLCLQRPTSNAITTALQRVGHPDGLVVVIHDADLGDIEGPYLSVPIRYAAAGSPGDLRAFTTGGEIDAFVQNAHPALVVVGDDGIEALPPGWAPPARWRYLGPFARNSRIYEP